MQTVHVRVEDAATRQPTPCRVRFTDAAGNYHAPLGRRCDFPGDLASFADCNLRDDGNFRGDTWAYINGTCEISLPPGMISVSICKGIEYVPFHHSTELPPGKMAMRFSLERWTDRRKSGWYAGDGRAHFASPHEMLLQASGEDLAFVNLLVEEGPSGLMPNIVAFSGQEPCLEKAGHMVVVNTHNVHPKLGSLGLLNCHRVVYPLSLGHDGEDDWTLADWCDQCHRKKGLVVWTDDSGKSRLRTEALADLVLGKIDAFEVTGAHLESGKRTWQDDWYTLLDAGLKVPLMGSSGARSNSQVLGRPRTYAQLRPEEEPTYRNWIEAVRAGRTYVTSGPLIDFTLNGQGPGSVIELAGGQQTVSVRVQVQSLGLFYNAAVICNGNVAVQAGMNEGTYPMDARLNHEISMPEGGWLIACCWGHYGSAFTSPVYVDVPGRVPLRRVKAQEKLADLLAKILRTYQRKRPANERLLHVLKEAIENLPTEMASRAP